MQQALTQIQQAQMQQQHAKHPSYPSSRNSKVPKPDAGARLNLVNLHKNGIGKKDEQQHH